MKSRNMKRFIDKILILFLINIRRADRGYPCELSSSRCRSLASSPPDDVNTQTVPAIKSQLINSFRQ